MCGMANNDEILAHEIASRLSEQLPSLILSLLQSDATALDDSNGDTLWLECSLSKSRRGLEGVEIIPRSVEVAVLDLRNKMSATPTLENSPDTRHAISDMAYTPPAHSPVAEFLRPEQSHQLRDIETALVLQHTADRRHSKRRNITGSSVELTSARAAIEGASLPSVANLVKSPKRKRLPDSLALQPSTLEKFLSGIWDSLYSGMRLDPSEVIAQWNVIAHPRFLVIGGSDTALVRTVDAHDTLGWMTALTRKISQASRACRSLEVIVQAHWIECFDAQVAKLAGGGTREKAKKAAIAEACIDFSWSEKELRNKMAIWRGYHDVKTNGGWAALVFAGMGLYRFCKYRVSFTDDTFTTLRSLRHRFEVAADTLHPRWRQLLGIIGGPAERRYTGHAHDWVVCGPGDEAIPLPTTYHQWDPNFAFEHLEKSCIDRESWGESDPRAVDAVVPDIHICPICNERQNEDPKTNGCVCFPTLYGKNKEGFVPLQVFRTPNGKNNGLLAVRAFEMGAAVGEFIGQITSGISGKDVARLTNPSLR